jgi:hypothetical protein
VHANPFAFVCDTPHGGADAGGAFRDDCVGASATYGACAAFLDSGIEGGAIAPTCTGCLFSPEDAGPDGGYGAIVVGVVPVANVAGCIELSAQTDAGLPCAQAVQAAAACVEWACRTSCAPVVDDTTRGAFLACTRAAATSVCSTYAQAASACVAAETDPDGGDSIVTMQCFNGATPADQAAYLLQFFCGS